MPYLPKNRSHRSYKKELVSILAILAIGSVFFSYFDAVLMRIAAPIWSAENAVSMKFWSMTEYFKTKSSLIKENEALRRQVESDAVAIELNKTLLGVRESLLAAYGRTPAGSGIAASVLVRPPVTPYDVVVVDAGEENGVKVGDSVSLPEGGRIGTVIEAFDKISKVKLYSTSGDKNRAILERGGVPIELLGQGGGSLLFTLPREIPVVVGDRILSPNVVSPLIRVVEDVGVTPTDSFKNILVQGVAPVQSLRFVLIEP